MYANGLFLRPRYAHLFPANGFFHTDNMRTLTSPPDRCVMSLQSFMAGFLQPPAHNNTISVHWQPFGMEVDSDGELVYFLAKNCPIFQELWHDLQVNPPADVQQWLKEDQEILVQLGKVFGLPLDYFLIVIMVGDLIRTNISMPTEYTPDWAREVYYTTLEKYLVRFLNMAHETEEMMRIRGSPLITEIVNNFDAVAEGRVTGKSFLIYSSHDLTIITLARVIGVYDQLPALASYADTIMLELVDNEGGKEMQVQAVYVDYAGAQPQLYHLSIPGCEQQCSLTMFKEIVREFLVDLADVCGETKASSNNRSNHYTSLFEKFIYST